MCVHVNACLFGCTCMHLPQLHVEVRGVFLNCFFFLLVLVPQLRLLLLAEKLYRMGNRKIQKKMGLSLSLELPILATHPHRHLVLGSQTSAAAHDFHVGAKSAHACAAGASLRVAPLPRVCSRHLPQGQPPDECTSGEDQLIRMPPCHV